MSCESEPASSIRSWCSTARCRAIPWRKTSLPRTRGTAQQFLLWRKILNIEIHAAACLGKNQTAPMHVNGDVAYIMLTTSVLTWCAVQEHVDGSKAISVVEFQVRNAAQQILQFRKNFP
jgi:hypothetical protein